MKTTSNGNGPKGFGPAEEIFSALLNQDMLLDRELGPNATPHIAFSRLYAYALDADAELDQEIGQAITKDPRLARDFDRLLNKTSMHRLPQVIAASSGGISYREGRGCRINFRESQANPNQIFVIIELEDKAAAAPRLLFVKTAADSFQKFPLPEAVDGIIQVLEESGSDLVMGLRNIDTEIFLS